MLHRSFKPAKCKTALKLAVSRIKLLKNKKVSAHNQLKREVSQLLESGQDRTARIRVEHVVREEKTMAAFELIEIYCELIVARLSIIESQKNCPIDLKEAITSVIFASPRCAADIPELLDIRKHFTAKYGKEFISSAVELRPNCGVNRMLVEKLSANAPDLQTKIKVLSTIAEEHNIKWDPNSLEEIEGKPVEDLLNGPNTFQNGNKMYVESPDVQAPLPRNQKLDQPVNPYEHNRNSSLNSQNSTDVGASKIMSASAHPEPRPSRIGSERMEFQHSFSGEGNDFSLGRQNWNMEFKDATAAAQAAAESAERASMAARAAAELSTREKIIRQNSKESEKSSVYGIRGEGRQNLGGSKLQSDNSLNNSFHGTNSRVHHGQIDDNEKDNQAGGAERFYSHSRKSSRSASLKSSTAPPASPDDDILVNSRVHHGQIDGNEKDNKAGEPERFYSHSRKSSRSASLKSSAASPDDDIFVNSPQKTDGYSLMSPSGVGVLKPFSGEFYGEMAEKQQSSKYEGSEKKDGIRTSNFDYSGEQRFRKQSSSASSRSHSSTFGDDHEYVLTSNDNKFENDIGHELFGTVDRENIQIDTKQSHSYDHAALAFDDSGSDDDDGRFGVEHSYSRKESAFYTSPGRKPPIYPESTYSLISGQNQRNLPAKSTSQSHLFTEAPESSEGLSKSEVTTEPDDLLPVTFDHSDGPSSDSEEELVKSKLSRTECNDESQRRSDFGVMSTNQRSPRLGKTRMGSGDMDRNSFQSKFDEAKSWKSSKLSSVHEITNNVQTAATPHALKDDDFSNQSTLDDSKELNFGGLTGGFRHKGFRRPFYTGGPSTDVSSSSKSVVEDSSATISEFTDTQIHKVSTKGDKKSYSKAPDTSSDSDSDDFNQEPASQKAGSKLSNVTSSKLPSTYFDSDTGVLEEDLPQQNSTSKGRLGSGFSRRTRGSPSLSEKSSISKVKVSAEGSLSSDHGSEWRPSKFSYATEKPSSTKQTTSKPTPESKNTLHEERLRISAKGSPSRSDMSSYSKVEGSSEGSLSSDHGSEWRPSKFSYATGKPSSPKQTTSKPSPESKNSFHEERLRTSAKGSSFSEQSSYSKVKVSAEGSLSSDHASEGRPSKFSYSTEKPSSPKQTTSKPTPESKNTLHEESLRTSAKGSPPLSERNSYSKVRASAEGSLSSDNSSERRPSKFSYASEKPSSPKQTTSKPMPESMHSAHEERLRTSAIEKPSSIFSSKTESSKTSSSSEKIPSRENSLKKASHVHPKLPDYDSLTAHLQSLRTNQK